jgi:hypothetical protein
MAYNQNIPQATDNPAQSQGQLLGNFQEIYTLIGTNHENFGSALEGNHFMVTWTDNTGDLPAAPTGTNLNIYNAQDAATVQQLWLQGPAATRFATAFPFTSASITGTNSGWTYLPSGVKMWFFRGTLTSSPTTVVYTTAVTGFPGFTNPPMVMVNPVFTANTLLITSITNTQVVFTNSSAGTAIMFAIGI